jgi:hypothetical protein
MAAVERRLGRVIKERLERKCGLRGSAGSTSTPGNSAGSPFNPNNAKEYAGNPGNPNPDKAGNLHPVSQYDVACVQQTQNGH